MLGEQLSSTQHTYLLNFYSCHSKSKRNKLVKIRPHLETMSPLIPKIKRNGARRPLNSHPRIFWGLFYSWLFIASLDKGEKARQRARGGGGRGEGDNDEGKQSKSTQVSNIGFRRPVAAASILHHFSKRRPFFHEY
jgi:hypothetical protein